jgi:protein TonB
MSQNLIAELALPPLQRATAAIPLRQRLGSGLLVVLLHVALAYVALYWSVRNEVIALPSSISVRLLPMLEERSVVQPTPVAVAKPATAVRKQTPSPLPPVMTTSASAARSDFVVAAPPVQQAVAPPATPAAPAVATPAVVPVTAARFDADYLHNPKPVYPPFSRRVGEEGKVLLKVRVSAQGGALDVAVSRSSGFPRLDSAAVDAVARWRFVPARRGDEPVESSVIVPISFTLD